MAGKTLTSSLIVRLVDQVSAPARKVGASLLGLNNDAKGGFGAKLTQAIDTNNAALDRARAQRHRPDAMSPPARASASSVDVY